MSRRRRFKFSTCGHLGLGAECQRCADALKIETLITDVDAYFTKVATAKGPVVIPAWLHMDNGQFTVRTGTGKRFMHKGTASAEMGKLFFSDMTDEVTRLRKPQAAKSKIGRLVDGSASSTNVSLADTVS